MAREASESLLERIEQAQEDRRAAQRSGASKIFQCVQSDCIGGESPWHLFFRSLLRGLQEHQPDGDHLGAKGDRLFTNPSILHGLQPLLPGLGNCFGLSSINLFTSFHLVSLGEDSACHFLCGLVCQDLGLCFPRGSDKVPLGSNCR